MTNEEELLEGENTMEENPLFAPDEFTEPVKPSFERGFKMWWDGWE